METEEIYDVLMELFLRAVAKYDPHYSDKLKQAVEVIENALSKSPASELMTSTSVLSLAAIAICACCAAVAFLHRKRSREREQFTGVPMPGRRRRSSTTEQSELQIVYRSGYTAVPSEDRLRPH